MNDVQEMWGELSALELATLPPALAAQAASLKAGFVSQLCQAAGLARLPVAGATLPPTDLESLDGVGSVAMQGAATTPAAGSGVARNMAPAEACFLSPRLGSLDISAATSARTPASSIVDDAEALQHASQALSRQYDEDRFIDKLAQRMLDLHQQQSQR